MLRYTEERNKPASVWQGWMSHRLGGRQVHPDQTKAVKGQNGKTLVTTGTIKGPLPCRALIQGVKNRAFLRSEKKKQSKKRRKKIRKKNREEKKGN